MLKFAPVLMTSLFFNNIINFQFCFEVVDAVIIHKKT
jgi:hypothetical protein